MARTKRVVDHGFPPIERADARVLILGSLPGQRSLQQRQYYAQPRNAFWRVMGELFGAVPQLSYAERTQRLIESRIALWDVCACAHRPGSLDAAIDHATVEVNPFEAFFRQHEALQLICFNGATAARLYARNVLAHLPPQFQSIATKTLPSTSPAHAAMPFDAKLALWAAALR
jgi:TDG/mug DNA glycosylase family protein